MKFKLLNKELNKELRIQLDDYYKSLYDHDDDYIDFWDDCDHDDWDDIKMVYLTRRNGCYSKKTLRFGRKIDLVKYYSKSTLREKKIEALLDGKPLNYKNYLDSFLNEESKKALSNFKIKILHKYK